MGRKRNRGRPVHGWIVLDKPLGMTSTQAVAKVRNLFDAAKAGHAGTLDPLATGLLPIALGEATKTVPYVMEGEKAYRFTLRFGIATNTDDAEGKTVATSDARPTDAEIRSALPAFTGEILQRPPAFSAIKVEGERAYDLARDGEEVVLEARPVEIDALTLVDRPDPDHAVLEVTCGKGTYVRALARDLGAALGTCAHVVALRRTRVAPFGEEDAISLDSLEQLGHKGAGPEGGSLSGALLPLETALDDIPALALAGRLAELVGHGQAISVAGYDPAEEIDALALADGRPLALGVIAGGRFHPRRILNLG
ncbi:tRNA pseudouridine(55) synthase TruB [Futiania mangrovi]|uniref:tRNA pseudouridine synthase B n=1 Tax=Futiania mangrovi TaxID=2959716 RepID=A0A9J6PIQ3_9PROT|nr:tRNA pseudouridine(55) synthase TruB [Futiania mangrovii]MCP1336431.1 tRNA pseudouridine(55) synthase TruB [Futiania mangrovii]